MKKVDNAHGPIDSDARLVKVTIGRDTYYLKSVLNWVEFSTHTTMVSSLNKDDPGNLVEFTMIQLLNRIARWVGTDGDNVTEYPVNKETIANMNPRHAEVLLDQIGRFRTTEAPFRFTYYVNGADFEYPSKE